MKKKIVILAGGISSRMKKASEHAELSEELRREADTRPKSMIRLGDGKRPFLDHLLMSVASAGYRDCVLVVNDRDTEIQEYYRNQKHIGDFHGMTIAFAIQAIPDGRSKPLGTGDALECALRSRPDWAGSCFTMCNSDNLYSVRALSTIGEESLDGAMIDFDRAALEFPRSRIAAFAVLQKNAQGYLVDIIEKPSTRDIESVRDDQGRVGVSMNLFRFAYDKILPCLEKTPIHPLRLEKELPDAVRILVRNDPRAIKAIPLAEHVPDLTSKEDILAIKQRLESEFRRHGALRLIKSGDDI